MLPPEVVAMDAYASNARVALGRRGEDVAAQTLTAAGMVILDRNWRCELGELDIVARDGDTLVFCEVKTRSGDALGHPFEAVTPRKAARLRRLAARWLAEHPVRPRAVRLDVVGVLAAGRRPAAAVVRVEHLEGVG
jgi:putative endonuclease